MDINALLMDDTDNGVTCVTEVAKGGQVTYQKGREVYALKAETDIPYCHKIALEDLAAGAEVRKYGEIIGRTTRPIPRGHWVSHENILSVPRDYEREFIR